MKRTIVPILFATVLLGSNAWAGDNPDLYGSPLFDTVATRASDVQPGAGDSYASVLFDSRTAKPARATLADRGNPDLYGCPLTDAAS